MSNDGSSNIFFIYLIQIISILGPVTKKYLKYHGGWGTVTFESNRSRNMFLKDKSKHKVGSKLVDVKPYIYNPDKVNKV